MTNWQKWSYDNPPVEGAFLTERGWEIENDSGIREVLVAIGGGAVSDTDEAGAAEIASFNGVDSIELNQETYATGDTLNIAVYFSEEVTVDTAGGTPTIPVFANDGVTKIADASYARGSSTNKLEFEHTVLVGDSEATGIAVGADIALNSGTIVDKIGGATSDVTFEQIDFNGVTINA